MKRTPDCNKIAAAFHRKAGQYDQHILVQKRVVAQLVSSLELQQDSMTGRILDVGTGTGALLERLAACCPHGNLTGVDIAVNMCQHARQKLGDRCHFVNGDAECLPFQSNIFDFVVSASVLQWVGNLSAAFNEMYRVVRPGGNISLAFFCDGTLAELHHCFRDAVIGNGGQETSRLHSFRTMVEVRSLVEEMPFEKAVITVETETDWYDDLYSLLRSIKNIGAGTVTGGSVNGLGWRGVLAETSRLYEKLYGKNSRIPATYKVLYLSAHKPA